MQHKFVARQVRQHQINNQQIKQVLSNISAAFSGFSSLPYREAAFSTRTFLCRMVFSAENQIFIELPLVAMMLYSTKAVPQ
ncbi:MAG: hypothetical protein R3C26_21985 [Calditrichia bacterium]